MRTKSSSSKSKSKRPLRNVCRRARQEKRAGKTTGSVRAVAAEVKLPKSTVHRLLKRGEQMTPKQKQKWIIGVIQEAHHQLLRKSSRVQGRAVTRNKVVAYAETKKYLESHINTCGSPPLCDVSLIPAERTYYKYLKLIPSDSASRTRKRTKKTLADPKNCADYGYYQPNVFSLPQYKK